MTTWGQHRDNFETTFKQAETTQKQFWRNFGTTLRQFPDRHGSTFGQLWDNCETTSVQVGENFQTNLGQNIAWQYFFVIQLGNQQTLGQLFDLHLPCGQHMDFLQCTVQSLNWVEKLQLQFIIELVVSQGPTHLSNAMLHSTLCEIYSPLEKLNRNFFYWRWIQVLYSPVKQQVSLS